MTAPYGPQIKSRRRAWRVLPASTSPPNKRVEIGLTYIHGIGPAKAKEICGKLGIPPSAGSRT